VMIKILVNNKFNFTSIFITLCRSRPRAISYSEGIKTLAFKNV